MKNRIKRYWKGNPDLKRLFKEIEEKQRKILYNIKDTAYVELAGKVSVKKDGAIYRDIIDIIDISDMLKFFDLKDKPDFNTEDVKVLTELIPSIIECKKKYIKIPNDTLTPLRLALIIAEMIGNIPIDKYIARHHKKIGDDKTNAVESIELTKILLEAMLTIQDDELKVLTVASLLRGIPLLEEWRDGIEIEELSFEEGRKKAYKECLELCKRYKIDTALIDRAFDLEDEGLTEIKPDIDEIMKGKGRDEEQNKKVS